MLTRIGEIVSQETGKTLSESALAEIEALLRAPGGESHGTHAGQDFISREVTILLADLRGFTRIAEQKLPYDVVFILNRYFEAVGGAVAQAGGVANQYTGDGVMALFGIDGEPALAARQALQAAGAMIARIEELSRALAGDLKEPLRLGIGIHIGPAVVGEMGYDETRYLTAVGDTVNLAARLQGLAEHGQILISVIVRRMAGLGQRTTNTSATSFPCKTRSIALDLSRPLIGKRGRGTW